MADAALRRRIAAPPRYRLQAGQRLIRAGPFDPTTRLESDRVWRATRTPQGPATFHARQDPEGVSVEAWGPGAAWVMEHADALLGLDDHPEAFAPDHAEVATLHRRHPIHLPRTLRVFEFMVPQILQQLVTWRDAMHAYRGMVKELGEWAPGPPPPSGPLRLPPGPDVLAKTPAYALRPLGVSKRQADTIRRVATVAPKMEAALEMDLEAGARRLQAINGVGPWTSHFTLGHAAGQRDALPLGDLKLPRIVGWLVARDVETDDARMVELLKPFAGHRFRVIALVHTVDVKSPDPPARRRQRRPTDPDAVRLARRVLRRSSRG